ncbi:ABC transporter permease [Nocardia tengchongensis]
MTRADAPAVPVAPPPATAGAQLLGRPVRAVRALCGNHSGLVDRAAAGVLLILVLLAVAGSCWTPDDPYHADPLQALRAPGLRHLLGTDDLGRDVASRVLAGASSTLLAAVGVTLAATVLGVAVAVTAALSPRWLDATIMRLCEIVMAVPTLVLALGIAAALGPSQHALVIAMVVTLWPGTARLARTTIRTTMSQPYFEGARRMGAGPLWLIRRHLLPNSLDQIYVAAGMEIGGSIVIMSGLAFIGVGAPPPDANWGNLVAAGQAFMTTAWWIALFPGLLITLCAMAFGILGDALRVRLDPEATS